MRFELFVLICPPIAVVEIENDLKPHIMGPPCRFHNVRLIVVALCWALICGIEVGVTGIIPHLQTNTVKAILLKNLKRINACAIFIKASSGILHFPEHGHIRPLKKRALYVIFYKGQIIEASPLVCLRF